jgi:hypothetical protein
MPITFRITRAALPDTIVTEWNDAVSAQALVVRVNGAATGAVIDPFNSILKRVVAGTADTGPLPGVMSGLHLRLRVTPNPARGRVTLSAAWLARDGIPGPGAPSRVRFRLYDASGRLVRDLGDVRGSGPSGTAYAATWDGVDRAGRRMPAGLYFAEIVAGAKRDTRPLTYLP